MPAKAQRGQTPEAVGLPSKAESAWAPIQETDQGVGPLEALFETGTQVVSLAEILAKAAVQAKKTRADRGGPRPTTVAGLHGGKGLDFAWEPDMPTPGFKSPPTDDERDDLEDDPRFRAAFARGEAHKEQLLQEMGGVYSSDELRDLLGPSEFEDRLQRGVVLYVTLADGKRLFPKWQFQPSAAGELLWGFDRVLQALGPFGQWSRFNFFLSSLDALEGERPIDLLRAGQLDLVLRAAKDFGEHSAS